jgi:hypothetical protein
MFWATLLHETIIAHYIKEGKEREMCVFEENPNYYFDICKEGTGFNAVVLHAAVSTSGSFDQYQTV